MSQIRHCKCDGCGKTRQYHEDPKVSDVLKEEVGWIAGSLIMVNPEGWGVEFSGDFCSLDCMRDKLKPDMFKRK